VPGSGVGRVVEGVTHQDQLDLIPAVDPDPIALLPRRGPRQINGAVDVECPAGERHTLGMISSARADHPVDPFVGTQLRHQVEGAPQLVRPHHLQIFALEVDLRPGVVRQSGDPLEGGAAHHSGDAHRGLLHVGGGDGWTSGGRDRLLRRN